MKNSDHPFFDRKRQKLTIGNTSPKDMGEYGCEIVAELAGHGHGGPGLLNPTGIRLLTPTVS